MKTFRGPSGDVPGTLLAGLGKAFEKQIKTVGDQGEKQIKALEEHGKQLVKYNSEKGSSTHSKQKRNFWKT